MVSPNRPWVESALLERLRLELADRPAALTAIAAIADCEGDLEDAAIDLAIRAGQQPDHSDGWLESMAKRCRSVICTQAALRQALTADELLRATDLLEASRICPPLLVLPVLLWVRQYGPEPFCQPLDRPTPPAPSPSDDL
jgi:hypothetical protein